MVCHVALIPGGAELKEAQTPTTVVENSAAGSPDPGLGSCVSLFCDQCTIQADPDLLGVEWERI